MNKNNPEGNNQPTAALIEGVFHANPRGFGFVSVEGESEDIFVKKGQTLSAMNKDLVRVRLTKNAKSLSETSAEGVVVEIMQHDHQDLVGAFSASDETEGFIGTVNLKNKKLPEKAYVTAQGLSPEPGDIVKVDITAYPDDAFPYLRGFVSKVLGQKGEKGIDVLEILESLGIDSEFPEEVLSEAGRYTDNFNSEDLAGRADFRSEITFTIDGSDAKDLDDAIHVKSLKNGNIELGVHIADVSWYVKEGSFLDDEALKRGTSVYVTDRVVPMLPEHLSNGVCSLNPQVDRLTQSCIMEINPKGELLSHQIVQSVIKTTYRMTYDAVNQMLEGDETTLNLYPKIADSVKLASKLHQQLAAMRQRRGEIEFVTKESKIKVDANGRAVAIELRKRGVAEQMIESFMLSANETVAKHFSDKKFPFIYRIHEHPKAEKLTAFIDFASVLGLSFKGTAQKVTPEDLQNFMKSVAGKPDEQILSMMLLRSMQQARYSEQNVGHFGLAADYYTHFTSPIRRYPDLLVHRLIREYVHPTEEKKEHFSEIIPEISKAASALERRAVDAERDVDKIKKAEYMERFVGANFEARISSVTSFGVFVELENTVEGLIHVTRFGKRFLNFNQRSLTLKDEKTGLLFKVGQAIKIKVVKADKETGDIDFEYLPSDLDRFEKVEKQTERGKYQRGRGNQPEKNVKKSKSPYYKDAAKGKYTRNNKRDGK